MQPIIIVSAMLLIYFAGLAYSVYSSPLPKQTFEEYAVGGRSFGWQFIVMTIIGTWYPGSLMIGWAQMGHDMGITAIYLGFYTLGGLFIFLLISGKLWKLGKKYNLMTMGHYFQLRYKSKPLRVLSGAAALALEFPWVVTELLASGYAIQAITGGIIPFNLGMVLVCLFFTAYILFSGTRAVIIADFYQGWMFVLGGLVLFLMVVKSIFGGFGAMFMDLRSLSAELLTVPGPSTYWGDIPGPLFWTSLIAMGILGAYMWPSLFSRIFAAGSAKELKSSLQFTPFVAPTFTLLVIIVAVGAAARPEFGINDSANALVEMIGSLGPVALGLICILILAGSLSMMDSMISTWSIVLINDVITPFNPDIKQSTQIKLTRITVVVIAFSGLLIAMTDLPTIVQILTRMYQGIVQFFPAVFLGLYWKKGNKIGATMSIIVGLAIVGFFAFTQPDYVPFLDGMQGGLLAVGVGAIVYIICGYLFKQDEGVEGVFEVMNNFNDEDLIRDTFK